MGAEENVIRDKSKGVSVKNEPEIAILLLMNSRESVEIDSTYFYLFP